MDGDITEMILDDLAERRSLSDIVQAVCEHTGMDWPHAEELVKRVEAERAHTIAARQTPMLVFLSAATSAGGILLIVYCFQLLAPLLHGDPLHIFLVLVSAIDGPLIFAGIGLLMIAGGAIGVYRTALRYFET